MGQPISTSRRYCYADYLRWEDGQRWELIDGEPFCMSPAPGSDHQSVSVELTRQIANHLLDSPCRVFHAPFDVRLPKADEVDDQVTTVIQPDLAVFCERDRLDRRGARGAPDWVIEILSPSTAVHDQVRKLGVYERAGVGEYWLVHPEDRVVTVYQLGSDGRYGRPEIAETRGRRSPGLFPDLAIDWDLVFAKLPAPEQVREAVPPYAATG
jgi:Uma2 family endonuclease